MRRVTKIGSVALDYKMFVREDTAARRNIAVKKRTVSGALVVYERVNRDTALSVTVESMDSGWQRRSTVDALISLADASIGQSVEIAYSDGTTEQVRFAYEERGGAVQFSPLFEGSEWLRGTIFLGKV